MENCRVLGAKKHHNVARNFETTLKLENNQVFAVEDFDIAWHVDSHDLWKVTINIKHSCLSYLLELREVDPDLCTKE